MSKEVAARSQSRKLLSIDKIQLQMLQNNRSSSILNVDVMFSGPATPPYQTQFYGAVVAAANIYSYMSLTKGAEDA